jgi:hypothetical protein
LKFAYNSPNRDVVKALREGENQDLEAVASAASSLIEFMAALMRAKHNAIQANDNPRELLNPNEFLPMLAEVSVLPCL